MTRAKPAVLLGVILLFGGGILSGDAGAAETRTEQGITFTIVDHEIPESLTGRPGNPEDGLKWFVNRKLGNCLACHKVSALEGEPYHGEIGPSLDGVASRLSEGEMRLRLVDPKVINPDTIMPAFFRSSGLRNVMEKFKGKTILTAQQIEDIIAFLKTLKEE